MTLFRLLIVIPLLINNCNAHNMSAQHFYLEYATGNANFGGHTKLILHDLEATVMHTSGKDVREFSGTITEEERLQLTDLISQMHSSQAQDSIPPGSVRTTIKIQSGDDEQEIVYWSHEIHQMPATKAFNTAIQTILGSITQGAVTK